MTTPATGVFAPFRPRRGRVVTVVFGSLVLLAFTAGAVLMPGPDEGGSWTAPDRLMLFLFGLAMASFLWRYAMIRAVPTREGLAIRNLLLSRRVEWSEVVGLQFAGGDPWVRLDLADTEQVAVMAIQKADGAFGRAEAARLASLVEAFSTAPGAEG